KGGPLIVSHSTASAAVGHADSDACRGELDQWKQPKAPRHNARRAPSGTSAGSLWGRDVLPAGDVHVRVWASQRQRVEGVLAGRPGSSSAAAAAVGALEAEGTCYCSGLVAAASTGTLYRYRLDGEAALSPDPASRFQLHGPHGPSQVIDPGVFPW